MKLPSRLLPLLLSAAVTTVFAQTSYPVKPIRWIIPFPAGGGADNLCRILVPKLVEALGQQIVFDNRGGAAGNIGAEAGAKSPPDGYTMVFAYAGTHSINRNVYKTMPFQESDFAPVIWMSSVPQVVVVHPSLPARNVKELIAIARARPGQINYGSGGNGSAPHLAGELFKMLTGVNMVHVPYKGGGSRAFAIIAGEVTLTFADPGIIMPHVKAAKLRALAVTSIKRSAGIPDLPTVAESGVPGYDVTSWNGVLVPAGTPTAIITRLNTEFNKALSSTEIREQLIASGYDPDGGRPERLGDLIRTETAKWAKVVKAANMTID